MRTTNFSGTDGKLRSAAQVIATQRDTLKLPELLKSEEHLRELWSNPATRVTAKSSRCVKRTTGSTAACVNGASTLGVSCNWWPGDARVAAPSGLGHDWTNAL